MRVYGIDRFGAHSWGTPAPGLDSGALGRMAPPDADGRLRVEYLGAKQRVRHDHLVAQLASLMSKFEVAGD